MSVNDYNKNKIIYQYIQNNIAECASYIIMGDFNGHTGFLGPHTINKNGEAMLDFIDKNNLILLNGHAECLGEITWQQNEKISTIDYIITNKDMHRRFVAMHIDEDREEFDLSDHNLLIAEFNINTSSCKQYSDDDCKEISYIKINEETTKHFMALVKSKIETLEGDITLEQYESILRDASSKSMLKTIKRRLSKINREEVKIWFNKSIESEIKIRKMYNRQKRVEEDKQKKNILEEEYRVQKRKTQYMIKEAITAHERNITTDIRNNKGHKKLWDIVNTLRGKKSNTDKEEYIYDDQDNKIEAKQLSNEITHFWRQIYQRHENQISLEWNTEKRDEYTQSFNNIEATAQFQDQKTHISTIVHEHFDSACNCETTTTKNQREEISRARWNEARYLKNLGYRRTVHTSFDICIE